jgi:ornithine cyclodeaminase
MRPSEAGLRVLTDDDVRARLSAERAVAAARRGLIAAHRGDLAGAPRLAAPVDGRRMVFSVGVRTDGWMAVRARSRRAEVVCLAWDGGGLLRAVVVGREMGARRTGALGAVAVDLLARADAAVIGVVGSGLQAWGQVWALATVRTIRELRVFSPNPEHRSAFAARATRELGLSAARADDAREAGTGADVVILATNATRPVIETSWIGPGAHVTTLGPKARPGHEAPGDLPAAAQVFATDFPDQVAAMGAQFFVERLPVSLGAVLANGHPGRLTPDDVTVYCSIGHSGIDVEMVREMLDAAPEPPSGR